MKFNLCIAKKQAYEKETLLYHSVFPAVYFLFL